jgi:D-sedoheptulose 7-phosphate isomerase
VKWEEKSPFEFFGFKAKELEGIVLSTYEMDGRTHAKIQHRDSPWAFHKEASKLTIIPSPLMSWWTRYWNRSTDALDTLPLDKMTRLCQMLENDSPGTLFVAGNGGSATICNHFALEANLVAVKFPTPVVSLCKGAPLLTCVANDWSFDEAFSRQLHYQAKPPDWLWCFSGSGTSPNLLRATDKAKRLGMRTFAFTGMKRENDHRPHLGDVVDELIEFELINQADLELLFFVVTHGIAYYFIDN